MQPASGLFPSNCGGAPNRDSTVFPRKRFINFLSRIFRTNRISGRDTFQLFSKFGSTQSRNVYLNTPSDTTISALEQFIIITSYNAPRTTSSTPVHSTAIPTFHKSIYNRHLVIVNKPTNSDSSHVRILNTYTQ